MSVLYCAHLCMKCSPRISNFLKEILNLPHSIVFLCFYALIMRKCFLFLLSILWNCAFKWVYFSFSPLLLLLSFSQLFIRPPQKTILPLFFLGMVLITASCTVSRTSVHSSSGTLSDLIPSIYLSFPLYNNKAFDLGHT